LGLKPIPHKNEGSQKKNQPNSNKDQHPRPNQRRKEKGKGKERETTQERELVTDNISLSNTNITTLLANNPT